MKINIKAITVMIKKISLLLGVIISSTAFADKVQLLDPKVSFQAVHRNGAQIWASGTNGGIYHSIDNGQQWDKIEGPKNSQDLQFRDIQPLDNGGLIVMKMVYLFSLPTMVVLVGKDKLCHLQHKQVRAVLPPAVLA